MAGGEVTTGTETVTDREILRVSVVFEVKSRRDIGDFIFILRLLLAAV